MSAAVYLGRPRELCVLPGTRLLIVGESSRAVLIDTALRRVVDTIEGWHFTVSPGLRWLIYRRFYRAATTVSATDQS